MIDSIFFLDHFSGKVVLEKIWRNAIDEATKKAYFKYLLAGGLDNAPFVSMHGCSFMHILSGSLAIILACRRNANALLLAETLRRIMKHLGLLLSQDADEALKIDDVRAGCVEIFQMLEDCVDMGFPQFDNLSRYDGVVASNPVDLPSKFGLWYAMGWCLEALCVPMRSLKFDAWIKQSAAEICLTQEYFNNEMQEIEAVFVFPLTSNAAVCGFEVVINDRIVKGVVKPKQEAKQQYAEALLKGDGAYLLEQVKPDVFQMNVGNIPPKTAVTLTVRYVTELMVEGSNLRLVIPATTTSSPRSSVEQTLHARVECTTAITSLATPSHSAYVSQTNVNECNAEIRIDLSKVATDFVLLVSVAEAWEPFVSLEYDPQHNTHALLLSFVPDLSKKNVGSVHTELILLVDRSGSMQDFGRIQQAGETLEAVIKFLPETCFFNVVGFGSEFSFLFPRSVSCRDPIHRSKALEYAQTLAANMGGTDILKPLEKIFSAPPLAGHTRQVFLLTDGEVQNPQAIATLVRQNANNTRVFTFGIGSASVALCYDTALAGGGKAEMIQHAADLRECVLRQLARALQPGVTDISMYWGGLQVTQAPCVLRPLFHGEPYRIYAFIDDLCPEHNRSQNSSTYLARLSGRLPGGNSVQFDLMIDPTKLTRSPHAWAPPGGPSIAAPLVIHTLAGREVIRELELGCSVLHLPSQKCENVILCCFRGLKPLSSIVLAYLACEQQAEWKPNASAIEKEITRVGVKYSLVSTFTSFLAIEARHKEVVTSRTPTVVARKPVSNALTGCVSWRTAGVKHRKNEVFVDVIERVECEWGKHGGLRLVTIDGVIKIKSFLSGMPELRIGMCPTLANNLEVVHQSVRKSRLEMDRVISLVPPDGEFDLATYKIDSDLVRIPFQLCVDAVSVNKQLEIIVKLLATFPKDKKAQCAVTVPLKEIYPATLECTKGTAKPRPERDDVIWDVSLYGGSSATLRIVCETDQAFVENCVTLAFEVHGMLCSDAKLSYIKTFEKAGYQTCYHLRNILMSKNYLCPYRVRRRLQIDIAER